MASAGARAYSPPEAEETFVFNSLVLMHFFSMFVKKWLYHYVLYMLMLQMWMSNGSQPTYNNAHLV